MKKNSSKLTLGEKISALRKTLNIQQEEFAERIGVSRQALSQWETDKQIPRSDKILEICRVFEISSDYFYSDDVTVDWKSEKPGFFVSFKDFIFRFAGFIAGFFGVFAILTISTILFIIEISPNINPNTVRVYFVDWMAVSVILFITGIIFLVFLITCLINTIGTKGDKDEKD